MNMSYLSNDNIFLRRGSVDDTGDVRYQRLDQNVPDGYVTAFQQDLLDLGFYEVETVDGVFGDNTAAALQAFQRLAAESGGEETDITPSGELDAATRRELRRWKAEHRIRPETGGLIDPPVPFFSQGDARWASRVLGRSSTLSREGCAVTCLAMVLRFFGREIDPGVLDEYLDANNGYAGNAVRWARAAGYPAGAPAKLAYTRLQEGDLKHRLRERLTAQRPTIARVDYGVDPDIRYNHFVVIVGEQQGDFVMNDPATAQGNGYARRDRENLLGKTTRKGGYTLTGLDWLDPVEPHSA